MENKTLIAGLDSNVLCYVLDQDFPEHKYVDKILLNLSTDNLVALNPTVLHEVYHVLVFQRQWFPEDAAGRLSLLLKHPYVGFYSQTKNISKIALALAVKHSLGGRDALMIANYLVNKVPLILTHDQEILNLGKLSWRAFSLTFKDPIKSAE